MARCAEKNRAGRDLRSASLPGLEPLLQEERRQRERRMSSPSAPGKMEAKPLFNVQKALVQPVQMCMLDIPLSVQDDDVSGRRGGCQPLRGLRGQGGRAGGREEP